MPLKEVFPKGKNLDGATCKVVKSFNGCYTLPIGTNQSATFLLRAKIGEEVSES